MTAWQHGGTKTWCQTLHFQANRKTSQKAFDIHRLNPSSFFLYSSSPPSSPLFSTFLLFSSPTMVYKSALEYHWDFIGFRRGLKALVIVILQRSCQVSTFIPFFTSLDIHLGFYSKLTMPYGITSTYICIYVHTHTPKMFRYWHFYFLHL